jgi:NTE family protein
MKMEKKRLNLALQGGGSHGAFTWGVLDRLLEEEDLQIVGVSGTSAGAVNGVALVYGLATGGPEQAKKVLRSVWSENSKMALCSPFQQTWYDRLNGPGNLDHNSIFALGNLLTPMLSPYQCNPINFNPMKMVLNKVIDFSVIQNNSDVKLFLSASNIRTSKVKVFPNNEITVDTVLASSCLPQVFQAVEIEGEHYWDGGYLGNPAMFPLFEETDCKDLLVIQIDSTDYRKLPKTPTDIMDRVTSMSFNSSLMREMRAIHFVNKIVDKGFDDNGNLQKINIHLIRPEETMSELNMSSKVNAAWSFLTYLRDCGRLKAEAWLQENYALVGKQSSCDMETCFF